MIEGKSGGPGLRIATTQSPPAVFMFYLPDGICYSLFMRFSFGLVLIVLLIFSTSYWYANTAHICPAPITYRLGQVDERFDLGVEELKAALAEAEAVWELAVGRELFTLKDNGRLVVNLIFDERQQLAHTQEEWRIRLDKAETRHQKMVSEIRSMTERYEADVARYDKARVAYESQLSEYNQKVASINSSGGATPEEFSILEMERQRLAAQAEDLERTEASLKRQVDEINTLGAESNQQIVAYNAEVEQYNALFGQLEPITQGEFGRTAITVYKFASSEELIAVLAHEFGHALGIGHVDDEASLMYYLRTEKTGPLKLSLADQEAFRVVCGEEGGVGHTARGFIRQTLEFLI